MKRRAIDPPIELDALEIQAGIAASVQFEREAVLDRGQLSGHLLQVVVTYECQTTFIDEVLAGKLSRLSLRPDDPGERSRG